MKPELQRRYELARNRAEQLCLHAKRELSDWDALHIYVRALKRCDMLKRQIAQCDKPKLFGTEL